MIRILFICHTRTYFTGLAEVGNLLKQYGNYEPVFLFPLKYPDLHEDIDICCNNNFQYIVGSGVVISDKNQTSNIKTDIETTSPSKSLTGKYLPMMITGISITTGFFMNMMPVNVVHQLYLLKQEIRFIRQIIREKDISLIILPADNRYDQALYIKAAHLENVPSVVIPQFMAGPLEWAEFVWDKSGYSAQKIINRLVGTLYPHWIYEHKGRKLIAKPANQVLAYELMQLSPPLPWTLHSGYADLIALESDAVRDYCINEGLPENQLVVTGSCVHDKIANIIADSSNKKIELCNNMGLSPDIPIIMSALPPDSLIMERPLCEFQNYMDLLEFWCLSLASVKGFNIIISIHPSVKSEDMMFIEKWGVKIAKKPIFELIPLCELFVASISATIQWAIACGKPSLNYDVYQYHYTDYVNVSSVITVNSKADYINCLNHFTSQSFTFQLSDANRWGRLDGRSGERLIKLFDNVIDKYYKDKEDE